MKYASVKRRCANAVAAALFLALAPSLAYAKKFDLNVEKFATYIGGSFGTSRLQDSAYGASSGNGTYIDKKVPWNTSGDFGVVISGSRINLLLGAELLMPRSMSGVEGKDTSNNTLFTMSSVVQAFIPMVNLEILAYKSSVARTLLGAGGGYALVSMENSYQMTSAGTSALGVGDYVEHGKGTGTLLQGYIGEEFLFTDNVTMTLTAGYRYCIVQSLASTENVTAITGAEKQGADLLNNDGGHRTLDLGGGFVGLAFRVYLGR